MKRKADFNSKTRRYTRLSISNDIEKTKIDPITGMIEPDGFVTYENTKNYISLELSPQISYKLNQIVFDIRIGLSGDIYINEYDILIEKSEMFRNKEIKPIVFSFVSGIGIGFNVTEKIKLGIRSSISRTISDIYKKQNQDLDIYYVNFQNVLYTSLIF